MTMPTVNGKDIIQKQLRFITKTEVVFPDGRRTILTPVKHTPQPDGACITLDGVWKVKRWPFPAAEQSLAAPETDDADWETVVQPGKVFYADPEAEKQLIPDWNRVTLSHIHDDDGAVLRCKTFLPEEWVGKRIYLRFDGIYPAGRIYLNGELLGEHTSGLTPVEFDVTGKATLGRDTFVAVRLMRKHKFVKMDMARHSVEFAGLSQSTYFFATEQVQISDYHLISGLNETCDRGTVSGAVSIRSYGPAESVSLAVTLADAVGRCVATYQKTVVEKSSETVEVPVTLLVERPALWNDEYPNLYTVTLVLSVPSLPEQKISYRTGFRRLDLKPEGPTLNGKFIKFRGVNHLTYHPEYGMYTPKDWLRQNLSLMKKTNVNAIRTHFLGPRGLADICDQLGIYLLQELPIDWGTNYIHDPEWVGPALMRIEGGIRRDRHHPSVMVWSVGNENMPESAAVAEDGWNHLRIYDQFCKALDPSRPTMFPPPGPANKIEGIFEVRVGDIADTHYSFNLQKEFRKTGRIVNPRSWEADTEEMTCKEALARGWSGVWFSSEYGLFNMAPELLNNPYLSVIDDVEEDIISGKNSLQVFIERMEREWGNMRDDRTCLGGAYFPWLCSGSGKNPWGWVRWGEDADWGVITADLLPKPYFWALRVAFSPVKFPARAVWKKGADNFTITLTNQFNAVNLKDCILRTQQTSGGKWMGMMRQFRDVPVSCPPGETVTLHIPIWDEDSRKALDEGGFICCRCTLLDPKGFRVITADILVMPESGGRKKDGEMPVGPDARLDF